IGKDRVSRVARYYALNATARPDLRGGARKVAENDAKKQHHFNLGFGHPATDACSSCARFQPRVKDPSLNEEEKRSESASYILHRRRARVFYDLLGQ
ncbi:hypothetical protein NQZ68_035877, partial [Dissostichus eleginoides]